MPRSQRSLQLTNLYRERLAAIRQRLEARTRTRWPTIQELDDSLWLAATAAELAGAQREAVRATQGYLAAFLTSELGRRAQAPLLDSRAYIASRDGRPLTEALESPLIGVRAALKEGRSPAEALSLGLNRALRMVGVDFDHAHRSALADAMEADERVEGWQRGVKGTCGACMGDIAVETTVQLPGVPLMVHPNCQCVTVPVVTGVRNLFPLPTGKELFDRMAPAEQDAGLGHEAAELIRRGDADLKDFVGHSPQSEQADFLTQRQTQEIASPTK